MYQVSTWYAYLSVRSYKHSPALGGSDQPEVFGGSTGSLGFLLPVAVRPLGWAQDTWASWPQSGNMYRAPVDIHCSRQEGGDPVRTESYLTTVTTQLLLADLS